MSKRRWLAAVKIAAVVAVVVAAAVAVRSSSLAEPLQSPAKARELVESMRPYDKAGFVLFYAVGALFLPGTLLSFAGAIIFGVLWGTFLVWVGAILGSLAPFAVARFAGRPAVETLVGDGAALNRFDDWIAERGLSGLLLVRLLPIFPYILVNYACGLVGVRLRDYLFATAVGILPGTFVYQYLFANVGERVLTDGVKWSYLADPSILAPIGLFGLFIYFGKLAANALAARQSFKSASKKDDEAASDAIQQDPSLR